MLYKFRYVAYDQNGPSQYSDHQPFYACGNPSAHESPIVSEITLKSRLLCILYLF